MKRRLLFSLIFTLILGGLCAQNYTVEPNPASGSADLDDLNTNPEDIVADAHITNHTGDSLFLRWERIVNDKPESWETAVCDVVLCYLPHISTKDFALAPNETGQMLAHAYPAKTPTQAALYQNGAVPGEATVLIKISNLNDPSDTLIAEYNFVLTGDEIVDVSEVELQALKVFPNPTTDYFRLTSTSEIQNIVVYNVLGRQIRSFDVQANQDYDVRDLPHGIFLIALNDRNNKTLKTVRLIKNNP